MKEKVYKLQEAYAYQQGVKETIDSIGDKSMRIAFKCRDTSDDTILGHRIEVPSIYSKKILEDLKKKIDSTVENLEKELLN